MPGPNMVSATPKKNLHAINPDQDVHAACRVLTTPQKKTTNVTHRWGLKIFQPRELNWKMMYAM